MSAEENRRDFENLAKVALRTPGLIIPLGADLQRVVSNLGVRGDGKCLWYSIVVSCMLQDGESIPHIRERDADGEVRRRARLLRTSVCDELWDCESDNFKDKYKDFWAPGEEGTEGASSPRKYISMLRKGKIFGGQLELHAAVFLLHSPILVVNKPRSPLGSSAFLLAVDADYGAAPHTPLLIIRSGLHFDAGFV